MGKPNIRKFINNTDNPTANQVMLLVKISPNSMTHVMKFGSYQNFHIFKKHISCDFYKQYYIFYKNKKEKK